MGRAPTPRPRIMKIWHARVCAPQSSLGLRAHLPCGAPPGGGLRAPPGSRLFPVLPRPAFSRFFPFVPAFRGLSHCAGARALDTIETSATSAGARPGFVGVLLPPTPSPGGPPPAPHPVCSGSCACLSAARVSGPAGPRPSHRSVLPAGPSPSFRAAVRRFWSRASVRLRAPPGGRRK